MGRCLENGTVLCLGAALLAAACTPTVKVEPPDKPIVINLNVKIEQEVRIRLERDVEDLIAENDDLF
ncbi:MAG: YnbE family lipoprotein [Pseudomonadota bacterium]